MVVTGVPIALVRRNADRPPASRRTLRDPRDVEILGGSLHQALVDIACDDPFDIDFHD